MSRITTTKDVCDKCGKKLRYPRLKLFPSKNRIQAFGKVKTWGDGYLITNVIELCHDCSNKFDIFMKGEVFNE